MRIGALLMLGMVAGLVSVGASAECVVPESPSDPPSGATATRSEMLAAQEAIKVHNAAVTVYADCVKKSGGNEVRANEVLRRLEKLADKFNAELRVFKQRNGT